MSNTTFDISNPPFTVFQVVSAVIDGHLDSELESLQNAIDARNKINTVKKAAMFKVGDKVRFVNGRPKYLCGLTATITGKKIKKFVIKFDEGQLPSYKYGGAVTCPAELLEKI
jgi:hypothetical protein